MVRGYKLENWKRVKWRNTLRQETTTTQRLVKRDEKGHFKSVLEIRQKSYGTGQYLVGIDKKGKIITRHKIGERTPEWYEAKKTAVKGRKILRTAYVLNDIPFRGNVYYGFRIIAFSHNAKLLTALKPKLKARLIRFIEQCIGYRQDEFWFDMYFGYEAPTQVNAYGSDNNTYYCMWTKRTGSELKRIHGNLGEL